MNRLHIAPHEHDRPRGMLLARAGHMIDDILDTEWVDCIENLSEDRCKEILDALTK